MFVDKAEWAVLAVCVLLSLASSFRLATYKKTLQRVARAQTAEKIGEHWYYIVDADQMTEMLSDPTRPENIGHYQADAAVAWLNKAGYSFRFVGDEPGPNSWPGLPAVELVRIVCKAVREAQP
jgi:hypothetical protein